MGPLPFNMDLMNFLADHRTGPLTAIFRAASGLGEIQGYIFVAMFIYVTWDKALAVRLSVLALVAMSLNHVLKILIKNPRPFIREGTYMQEWAVSADNARELAAEYSTPSGHAMAAGAFYAYLYACVRNPYVRAVAVLAIVLIGLSRPYLGVHYAEDILLGWVVGLAVAAAAIHYGEAMTAAWHRRPYGQQIAIAVVASFALSAFTAAVNGWRIDGQPRAFLGYAGFLTGIAIARPLELRWVNFDPRSSTVLAKLLRYGLAIGLTLAVLFLLDELFAALADKFSLAGYLLQYIRYTVVGVTGIFLAPLLFTRFGLAKALPAQANALRTPNPPSPTRPAAAR